MDPSSGPGAIGISKSELKNQELVVGASGFEPETSCAQGRRATKNNRPVFNVSVKQLFQR